MSSKEFKNSFSHNIFKLKYALTQDESWHQRAITIVDYVCGTADGTQHPILSQSERDQLIEYITDFKFLPGGRYIYYTGREARYYNNCFLLRAESDTREEWASLIQRAMSCLMTGGGIGINYSRLRPAGRSLRRTGGIASGPIPLMYAINEIGRNVMQGGSRRSALYASLNWRHEDIESFLKAKNWQNMSIGNSGYTLKQAKQDDFNFPAPLDMTNISVNYDDAWLLKNATQDSSFGHLERAKDPTFLENCRQAMSTGEPGFSFNFGGKENETLRNACGEVTSEDDSDVCNLGSINIGSIESLEEFRSVVNLASKFLVCGTAFYQ